MVQWKHSQKSDYCECRALALRLRSMRAVGLLLAAAVLEQEGLTTQGKKAALTALAAAHDLDVQVIVPSGTYLPSQMAASPGAYQ
jgi:hypothetical protein